MWAMRSGAIIPIPAASISAETAVNCSKRKAIAPIVAPSMNEKLGYRALRGLWTFKDMMGWCGL
jgi:hypothetical protein